MAVDEMVAIGPCICLELFLPCLGETNTYGSDEVGREDGRLTG